MPSCQVAKVYVGFETVPNSKLYWVLNYKGEILPLAQVKAGSEARHKAGRVSGRPLGGQSSSGGEGGRGCAWLAMLRNPECHLASQSDKNQSATNHTVSSPPIKDISKGKTIENIKMKFFEVNYLTLIPSLPRWQ